MERVTVDILQVDCSRRIAGGSSPILFIVPISLHIFAFLYSDKHFINQKETEWKAHKQGRQGETVGDTGQVCKNEEVKI